MASHMRTGLINEALAMATRVCPPVRGTTVFHSDRGSQYTSAEYAKIMADHGILPSVGRTGICYDNAAAESFNGTLKKELVNRKVYPTRAHAIRDVTSWIELRYNHTRPPLSDRLPHTQRSRHRTQTPQPDSLNQTLTTVRET